MFDHLSLGVRDLEAARRFYGVLFLPLGHALASEKVGELGFGPRGEVSQFFLYPVHGPQIAGLGAHIAFKADSRAAVDAAFTAAVGAGAEVLRAAGEHPDISPTYYGAVVRDPDGNKLEIVAGAMH